jgi:c-di-GMP-binding flagellar brake protein YcgR
LIHTRADRRRHTRIDTTLPVRCQSSHRLDDSAILIDLSHSGAQVLVNKGFHGTLQLDIEFDYDSSLQLQGIAVWSCEVDSQLALLGVQFFELGHVEKCCLTKWVDDHTRFRELLEEHWDPKLAENP